MLRAIEVEGFDRQPCGGTHLERTGQAGLLLIRKLERRRDQCRDRIRLRISCTRGGAERFLDIDSSCVVAELRHWLKCPQCLAS